MLSYGKPWKNIMTSTYYKYVPGVNMPLHINVQSFINSQICQKHLQPCALMEDKNWILWRIDLLVGSDHETNNETTFAARQQI
jgi:hypothetical protein